MKIIKIKKLSLCYLISFFNKLNIYYVKKNTAKFWYKNNIPFFRFGVFIS
jgi:hypothetical protein